jgi:hypothetical protein
LVESADLSEVEVEAKAKAKVKVKVEAEVEVDGHSTLEFLARYPSDLFPFIIAFLPINFVTFVCGNLI